MNILKPDTLALLYGVQPEVEEGKEYSGLVLACIACFPFEPQVEALLPENALWDCAKSYVPEGTPLDEAFVKPRGEFLVYGSCYPSPGDAEATRARNLEVRVGSLCKKLAVFGDRIWVGHTHSDPRPFSCIPVDWEHAYGGEDCVDNPVGMGRACLEDGVLPLPNIELCDEYITSPEAPPEPAGLGALPSSSPVRASHAGTFDGRWFAGQWPSLPEDVNPDFFMRAPCDQRFPAFFTGEEDFAVTGMHPEKETVCGKLPGIRCRVFVMRTVDEQPRFEELATHADTVTLFPECEMGALTFRAHTTVEDEECADINVLLAVFEPSNTPPESIDYYKRLVEERITPEDPVTPAEEPPGVDEDKKAVAENAVPLSDEPSKVPLGNVMAAIEGEAQDILKKAGLSVGEVELFLSQLEQENGEEEDSSPVDSMVQLQSLAATLEKRARDMLLQSGKSEEDVDAFLHESAEMETPPDLRAQFADQLADPAVSEQAKLGMRKMIAASENLAIVFASLNSLSHQLVSSSILEETPPQYSPEPEPAPIPEALTLDDALQRYRAGQSLAGVDLCGLDFSGQDLTGIDLRNALLRDTRFQRSTLHNANMAGADCFGADFSESDLEGVDLSDAIFEKTILSKIRGVNMLARGTCFSESQASEADFSNADLEDADFSYAVLEKARFFHVNGSRIRLHGSNVSEADFSGANLFNSRADTETCAIKANFCDAILTLAGWQGALLDQSNMTGAQLERVDFSHCSLRGVCFEHARARFARFFKSDLGCCNFANAVFADCMLRRAKLIDVNFSGADLQGADLYKCIVSNPKMDGADIRDTIRDPLLYASFVS